MKITTRGARLLSGTAALGALLALSGTAPAQDKAASADKSIRIEESEGMAAALKRLEGRPVKIRLAGGGEELSGRLQKVGKELVLLSELSGREFYDAVVKIDQISAVSAQVRGR